MLSPATLSWLTAFVIPPRVILIAGARRTGTTLLAALLSADPSTPPFPGESQLLTRWIETYCWAKEHFSIRALPCFRDTNALRAYHRGMLADFVAHCGEHFAPARILVLKSPELSLHFQDALELLPDADVVVSIRDPRDQVASEWRVLERRRSTSDLDILANRNFGALAAAYMRYYKSIAGSSELAGTRVTVQRFEDIAVDFEHSAQRLGAKLGLDLSAFDPNQNWPRIGDTYWAYGSSPSDTQHYGGPLARHRVGAYSEVMTEAEAALVFGSCEPIASRFGYRADNVIGAASHKFDISL